MSEDTQTICNHIERFIHCNECIQSLPKDLSPRENIHLEVGLTATGDIQVWCVRHERNVALFDIENSVIHTH
jgi:hypothetical protein